MSPRSRRKPATAPPADRLQLKIFAEGEKTETAYLTHWNRLYREYAVISIARHAHTTPFELVRAAADQRRRDLQGAKKGRGAQFHQYWCVFDVDEHPKLPEALDMAKANEINIALSSPCVELWFLLHFEAQTAHIHRHDAQRRCKEHLQCGKDLTGAALDLLVENFDLAKTRARALSAKHDADGSRQPWNPHSELWRLVDVVRGNRRTSLLLVVPVHDADVGADGRHGPQVLGRDRPRGPSLRSHFRSLENSNAFEYLLDLSPFTGQHVVTSVYFARGGAMGDQDESSSPHLTWRQRKLLQFVRDYFRDHGFGPSYREIAEAVGLASTSSVAYQLKQLEEKGYLAHDPRRPRTSVPADYALPRADPETDDPTDQRLTTVPLVGSISAGYGTLVYESVEDTLTLSTQLVGQGDLMALRVDGDSMINAAIAHDDLVIVRRQPDAENGQIVAALVEDETTLDRKATVKTLKRVDGHLWLVPHNPAFDPFMADSAQIIGKVVGVVRRL